MKHKTFSVLEAAKLGYKLTFRNVGLIVLAALTLFAISIGFGLLSRFLGGLIGITRPMLSTITPPADPMAGLRSLWQMAVPFIVFSAVVGFVRFLISAALYMGVDQVSFDLHDTGKSKVMRLFSCFGLLGKYLVSMIIFGAITAGMVLLVVPFGFILPKVLLPIIMLPVGFYVFLYIPIRLGLATKFIVDKKVGGLQAIKMSWATTQGHFWRLFAAYLLAPFMVLTVVGIPAVPIMLVAIYRKIS